MLKALYLALLLTSGSSMAQRSAPPVYDATPRLGILVPKGPPDYALWYEALKDKRDVVDGMLTFSTGMVSGVPVVLIVQPAQGEVLRALGATAMVHDFNVRVLLYPGTSGGHLHKGEMAVGDIVLGAKNVDHGNYNLSPSAEITAEEFKPRPGMLHFGPLYADPQLLSMLACSAHRVAMSTTVAAWMEPITADKRPQIFYYGIQGTSTIWSDNLAYTDEIVKVFHTVDEDGDWYSNLVGTLNHVPFLEVSVISNSIFAFPKAEHGTPDGPANEPNSHVFAQRISNRILLDLIAREGKRMLAGSFTEPMEDPNPAGAYETPHDPRALLKDCR